jgi:hypothetical protein
MVAPVKNEIATLPSVARNDETGASYLRRSASRNDERSARYPLVTVTMERAPPKCSARLDPPGREGDALADRELARILDKLDVPIEIEHVAAARDVTEISGAL